MSVINSPVPEVSDEENASETEYQGDAEESKDITTNETLAVAMEREITTVAQDILDQNLDEVHQWTSEFDRRSTSSVSTFDASFSSRSYDTPSSQIMDSRPVTAEEAEIRRMSSFVSTGQASGESSNSERSSPIQAKEGFTSRSGKLIADVEFGVSEGVGHSLHRDSETTTFLMNSFVGLATEETTRYVNLKHDEYLHAVEEMYLILLEIRPRLRYILSLAEWCHIHMILFYSRVFDCELEATKVSQQEFKIYIPPETKVIEPLANVLDSIGIVNDSTFGLCYVPVAKPIKNAEYKVHDPEDVTEFLEWTQYSWGDSWTKVERAREARHAMAEADRVPYKEQAFPTNTEKFLDWESLALEKWIGWDQSLWFAYKQAVALLSRRVRFHEISTSPRGTYSWILPVLKNECDQVVCRVPMPTVNPVDCMMALLFDLSGLAETHFLSWSSETKPLDNRDLLRKQYLRSALK